MVAVRSTLQHSNRKWSKRHDGWYFPILRGGDGTTGFRHITYLRVKTCHSASEPAICCGEQTHGLGVRWVLVASLDQGTRSRSTHRCLWSNDTSSLPSMTIRFLPQT